jgi:hypothetical protein
MYQRKFYSFPEDLFRYMRQDFKFIVIFVTVMRKDCFMRWILVEQTSVY